MDTSNKNQVKQSTKINLDKDSDNHKNLKKKRNLLSIKEDNKNKSHNKSISKALLPYSNQEITKSQEGERFKASSIGKVELPSEIPENKVYHYYRNIIENQLKIKPRLPEDYNSPTSTTEEDKILDRISGNLFIDIQPEISKTILSVFRSTNPSEFFTLGIQRTNKKMSLPISDLEEVNPVIEDINPDPPLEDNQSPFISPDDVQTGLIGLTQMSPQIFKEKSPSSEVKKPSLLHRDYSLTPTEQRITDTQSSLGSLSDNDMDDDLGYENARARLAVLKGSSGVEHSSHQSSTEPTTDFTKLDPGEIEDRSNDEFNFKFGDLTEPAPPQSTTEDNIIHDVLDMIDELKNQLNKQDNIIIELVNHKKKSEDHITELVEKISGLESVILGMKNDFSKTITDISCQQNQLSKDIVVIRNKTDQIYQGFAKEKHQVTIPTPGPSNVRFDLSNLKEQEYSPVSIKEKSIKNRSLQELIQKSSRHPSAAACEAVGKRLTTKEDRIRAFRLEAERARRHKLVDVSDKCETVLDETDFDLEGKSKSPGGEVYKIPIPEKRTEELSDEVVNSILKKIALSPYSTEDLKNAKTVINMSSVELQNRIREPDFRLYLLNLLKKKSSEAYRISPENWFKIFIDLNTQGKLKSVLSKVLSNMKEKK